MCDIRDKLVALSNKMNKIEDKDIDYARNPIWLKLKEEMNKNYLLLAKQELEFYKLDNEVKPTEFKQNKIKFYTDYIQRNERGSEQEN